MSESRTTRTINGVTETILKRRDVDVTYSGHFPSQYMLMIYFKGNEHVTHFSPDGQERYFLNGVDQSSHGASNRAIPPAPAERSLPPPPPIDRSIPPPPYPGGPIRHQSPTRKRERSSPRHINGK